MKKTEQILEIERLKAENAKLKGDVEKMGELLKEIMTGMEGYLDYVDVMDETKTGAELAQIATYDDNIAKIKQTLQAAGITE